MMVRTDFTPSEHLSKKRRTSLSFDLFILSPIHPRKSKNKFEGLMKMEGLITSAHEGLRKRAGEVRREHVVEFVRVLTVRRSRYIRRL